MTDKTDKIKIVLLPGLDGTGMLFDLFIKECPSRFKPIIVRYPHDKTMSYDDLEGFVRAQLPADEKYIILGESFSGPVAIRIAAHNPSNLIGVILSASFVKSLVPTILRKLPLNLIFKINTPDFILQYYLLGGMNRTDLLKNIKEAAKILKSNIMSDRVYAILNVDESDSLRGVTVPILYLRAANDRLVGAKSLDEIKKIKPDIKVVEFDAPHLLLQTRPVKAWQAITEFAESLF